MTLDEAKKVLGLGPDQNPADHLVEFTAARERIAALVRDAPNETIALRYQDGLLEFDKAMAAVREEIGRKSGERVDPLLALVPGAVSGRHISTKRADFLGLDSERSGFEDLEPASPAPKSDQSLPGKADSLIEGKEENATISIVPPAKTITRHPVEDADLHDEFQETDDKDETSSKGRFILYAVLFFLIGGIGGGWIYTSMEAERALQVQKQIIHLENFGARLVESRRWSEAQLAYREIEQLDPGSELAASGIRSIEVGMVEEQKQFVSYWTGESLAAFEAGRLDEALSAAKQVVEKYPEEQEAAELILKIDSERVARVRKDWGEKVRKAVGNRDWNVADAALAELAMVLPGDYSIEDLSSEISREKERQRQDHAKARELADAAKLRDQGVFDSQALEWMREAVALAPEDPEVRALHEKLASYSRTLRIPEDFKTLEEALSQARDRDRIVLGEGEFLGGVTVNKAVQLEGLGEGKSMLLMKAHKGPVLTFGPGAEGAAVTGLVLQHEGFDAGTSRYPVALVRGAEVKFSDCSFLKGSGHGLAVVEGGHGIALRSLFKTNGWDGAAASGAGSRLTISGSEALGNFGHGFEVWDGALAAITNCKSSRNSRSGVLVDSAAEGLDLSDNEVYGNREYGIVLNAGASGSVNGNSSYSNLMGGLLVRFAAISVVVEGNRIEKNSGPGLILEQGLRPEIYQGNRTRLNGGKDLMIQVRFQE